jgi:hypothetical protein
MFQSKYWKMKYIFFLIAATLAAATLTVGTIGLPQQVFGDESETDAESENEVDCTSSGFKYSQDCASAGGIDSTFRDLFQ